VENESSGLAGAGCAGLASRTSFIELAFRPSPYMILLPWHLITSLMPDSKPQPSTGASGDSKSDPKRRVYEQEALNYTLSQAGTSYAGSAYGGRTQATESTTGKESNISAYSYNSQRDVGKFVKEFEGRVSHPLVDNIVVSLAHKSTLQTFNVLSDTYYLPTGAFYPLFLARVVC
jgi:hypothetical protein